MIFLFPPGGEHFPIIKAEKVAKSVCVCLEDPGHDSGTFAEGYTLG